MKASELIKHLEQQINSVGDREVYFWNTKISNYEEITSTYSTCGSIECIALENGENDFN